MAEIKATINDTYFAWSGGIRANDTTSYFRVTGPTLLIEFSPQGLGCASSTTNGGGTPADGGAGGPPAGGTDGGPNAQPTNASSVNSFTMDLGTFSVVNDAGTLCHVHTIYRDPTNAYGSAITGS